MDAIIKIPSSELNEELYKKIALLLDGRKAIITIALHDLNQDQKSIDDYWSRLNSSIQEIENGNGINFTMSELEKFIHN